MSHANASGHANAPWDMDADTAEQSLADDNLHAQDHLWESLRLALRDSGRSLDDVASRLGISVDLVRAIGEGRIDVSLSDLREYAYAVDAAVTYRVSSRYTSNLENFRRSLGGVPEHWHRSRDEDTLQADSVLRRAEKLSSGQ